jgi:DNA-binding YbaB/EbfC family protein
MMLISINTNTVSPHWFSRRSHLTHATSVMKRTITSLMLLIAVAGCSHNQPAAPPVTPPVTPVTPVTPPITPSVIRADTPAVTPPRPAHTFSWATLHVTGLWATYHDVTDNRSRYGNVSQDRIDTLMFLISDSAVCSGSTCPTSDVATLRFNHIDIGRDTVRKILSISYSYEFYNHQGFNGNNSTTARDRSIDMHDIPYTVDSDGSIRATLDSSTIMKHFVSINDSSTDDAFDLNEGSTHYASSLEKLLWLASGARVELIVHLPCARFAHRLSSRTLRPHSNEFNQQESIAMSNPMMEAMQQLQLMQQKMAEAQAALENKFVTEEGGGGMVRVTADGLGRITRLELSPEAVSAAGEDKEMVEDLLIATINKTIESAKVMANRDIGEATHGLMPNIPGLDLPL